jgi:hypothetical protein
MTMLVDDSIPAAPAEIIELGEAVLAGIAGSGPARPAAFTIRFPFPWPFPRPPRPLPPRLPPFRPDPTIFTCPTGFLCR